MSKATESAESKTPDEPAEAPAATTRVQHPNLLHVAHIVPTSEVSKWVDHGWIATA